MATQNLLHNYRSYSYKHILIACNTTAIAEFVSNLDNKTLFSDIISQPGTGSGSNFQDGADANGIKISSILGKGDYCILINSFTDGEFFIPSATWQTILSPNYDNKNPNKDYTTTVATEGSITVVEPRGFRFLNVMHNVSNLLDCGAVSTIYVLKTVFVGHDDGSHQNEYISNIKPFLFNMRDLTASFDEGGSTYIMPIVGACNGIAKASEYAKVTLNKVEFTAGETLQQSMDKLQVAIQFAYDSAVVKNTTTPQYNPKQRAVKYHIKFSNDDDGNPSKYLNNGYSIDNINVINSGAGKSSGGPVSFGNNMDIESMIIASMKRCTGITDNAKTPEACEIFKIYTIMSTTLTTVDITYVITPMPVIESTDLEGTKLTHDGNFNVIEYDYIFTGKNIDIVDFQLKMQHGLVFFQQLEVVPLSDDSQIAHNKVVAGDTGGRGLNSFLAPNSQPVMSIYNTTRTLDKNARNPLTINDFNVALQKYASLETVAATITIHGNPQLISDMNKMPSDFTDDSITKQGGGIISNWNSVPSLCKINVSMPSNNSLLGVNLSDPNTQFQTPFWYRGYFNVLTIQHNFENGMFTQQLGMINVPLINQPKLPETTQNKLTDIVPPTSTK